MNAELPGISTSIELSKDSVTYVTSLDGSVYQRHAIEGVTKDFYAIEDSYSKVRGISIGGSLTWKIDAKNEKSYLLNDRSSWVETVDPASKSLKTDKVYGGKNYSWFIMEDSSIKKYDHTKKTWETLTEKAENVATSP